MMPAMGTLELRYLSSEITRHGRKVWYVRKGGRRTRLPDPSDAGFMAAYAAAVESAPAPPKRPEKATPGTLGWMIAQYIASGAYARLAPSTRAARRRLLDGIAARAGKQQIRHITRQVIIESRDARTRPEAANAFLKTMSALFSWATELGHATENPARGVPRIKSGSTGHAVWTAEDLAAYRARHEPGTRARLMFEILLGTGLRISDAAVLGRQHIRGGEITIRTAKTGVVAMLPVTAALQQAIDAMPADDLTFMRTEFGKAFTVKGLGQWFRDRCDEAGISKSAHGIRKAAATALADAGASEHQLMAVFCWKDPKEAAIYTREANRRKLARSAFDLISGQGENIECRTLATGATKTGKN